MSYRSVFGWSLPPGAAGHPLAPWNTEDGPCEVCGLPVDDCICPECPVCRETGNPRCYATSSAEEGRHSLTLSPAQVAARQRTRVALIRESLQEEERVMKALDQAAERREHVSDEYLGDVGSRYIDVNPDPWR